MKLPLDDILKQHVAVLGKTRSGKSSVMRGLVEHLLDEEKPVCIVDPKGDWWGIKLARDGKRPGYPVVIFGGDHADVPINEHSGAPVAELYATGNRPCLIDLGGWTVEARTQFWIDFASSLFKHTRGTRWLVVDEIHNFAPKGKVMSPQAGKMLHWTNRLASEGLGKGIIMPFASQRPQKVHNDTLTSAETLIAMRVLHPSDRGAISDWIKGCGDGGGDQVLGSLAQMERGEGWVWSPEIGFGPTRVKFPMFLTYDSFRPQTAEDTKKLKGWAEVDLDEVRAKLATVIETEKSNDPKALRQELLLARKRISDLERGAEVEHIVEVPAEDPNPALQALVKKQAEQIAKLKKLAEVRIEKVLEFLHKHAQAQSDRWAAQELKAREWLDRLHGIAATPAAPVPVRAPAPPVRKKAEVRPPDPPPHRVERDDPPELAGLQAAPRAVLTILCQRADKGKPEVDASAVSMLSGYKLKSSTLGNACTALRKRGFIDGSLATFLRATDLGRQAMAGAYSPLPSGEALRNYWIAKFSDRASAKMFRLLIDAWPKAMTRDELARQSGYSQTSSTFGNALTELRNCDVISGDKGGDVKAADELFEE